MDDSIARVRLRQTLIDVARSGGTTTYGEIGRRFRLDMGRRAHRSLLGRLLDDIDHDERAAGRPMLGALVVRKREGLPGRGFFACARALGRLGDAGERSFWESELAHTHGEWAQGHDPRPPAEPAR